MKQYVIKRVLSAIPLLIVISFVCFVFINLIPSDPAEVALRVRQVPIITEEAIAEVRAELGLDKPYLVRYFSWLADCLRGDFGISYVNPKRTVAGELARCMPATLQLAGVSFVMVILLSLPIGFLCAVYKDGWFDKIMRAIVFMTTETSDPPGIHGVTQLYFYLYPSDPQQHAGKYEAGLCPLRECQGAAPEADPCKTYPEKLHAHLYRCSRNEHSAADLRNDRGGKCVCMAWTRDALHQFYF